MMSKAHWARWRTATRRRGAAAAGLILLLGLCPVAVSAEGPQQPDRAPGRERADAPADLTRASELDRRFAALKVAQSEEEATPIIAEIWSLWHTSGDAAVDDLMSRILSLAIVGQGDKAEALIDEVIRLKPGFAEGWNQRATLRYHQGRFAESLADCVEVLKREPRHFGALSGMGLIALAQGDEKRALAAFRRALAENPFLAQRNLIPILERKIEGRPL